MEFTFGIVTNSENNVSEHLPKAIDSIRKLNISEYEIIIIGTAKKLSIDRKVIGEDVRIFDFNERVKKGWITKKKNMITEYAKFENIVYQHDYIAYNSDWYEGWKDFGPYKAAMNKIINHDGSRYRDWSIFPQGGLFKSVERASGFPIRACLLPYSETGFSKLQYFSGAYWVAKKSIMKKYPLKESLVWGLGEDVEWSERFRKNNKFTMNEKSSVRLLKPKGVVFSPMPQDVLNKMKDLLKKKGLYG
jgi:hypothetical protein